jgi:hypothetical protein
MTNIPTATILNCTTGEVIERPLTTEEIEQQELAKIAMIEREEQLKAKAESLAALKASAKSKLIAGQPLTAEEAEVIVL